MRHLTLPLVMVLVVSCSTGATGPSSTTQATPLQAVLIDAPSQTSPADLCHASGIIFCALNPDVRDSNVKQTICNPKWTAGLRPPQAITAKWKTYDEQAGQPPAKTSEGDHRMPLADLGGDPGAKQISPGKWQLTSQYVVLRTGAKVPANFSNEQNASGKVRNPKDTAEQNYHTQVCNGQMNLTEARIKMRDTWLGAYPAYKQ